MATPMPEDSRLAKVRSILAKAEDPAATPEEAQAYFAKAADLMAKYGIERAMLAETRPESDKLGSRTIDVKGSYILDNANLLMSIADAIGARSVRWRRYDRLTGRYYQHVKIYGHASTLDRVEMLYTSLLLQAHNGMKHGRPQPGESTTAYRKSWLSGFRIAVARRLETTESRAAAEAEALPGGRSAELVLVDRAEAVLSLFKREHPKIRTAPVRRLTGSGWTEGVEAGKRADLGQGRIAPRRAALSS
ncbi:DUF2786 domain-containing protein [Streptomyces sp. NPDC000229]|uniref:DUF2786 domain-containing protein n=1 Tax=Streptomyces sp. NPDC000229 TaxID=3154247 RepID=UPI00331A3500